MNFISPDYCKRVLADEFNFFLKIWKAYNGKVRSRYERNAHLCESSLQV